MYNKACDCGLLTRGVVMQQEGINEVLVDIMTVLWISIHKTHVMAEFCYTAHTEQEKKGWRNEIYHTV